MGRQPYLDRKTTVEEASSLSIFKLNEWGLLNDNCHTQLNWPQRKRSIGLTIDISERPFARLNYTTTYTNGNTTNIDYLIYLIKTQCYFQGVRYWFHCPQCGRRVGKLYLVNDDGRFTCRICNKLTYESRTEPRFARPGGIGYLCKAHTKIKEINAKRRTWGGMPTRKMRRIEHLKEKSIAKRFPTQLEFLNNHANRQV
jgi:hypothetical protein